MTDSKPNPIIAHLRILMAIADPADGKDDGYVNKDKAKAYLAVLIKRAEALISADVKQVSIENRKENEVGCYGEHTFLLHVQAAIQQMKKDDFDSAEPRILAKESWIENGLIKELNGTPEGKLVLKWKHLPECPGMDYSLPENLKTPVSTHTHRKREP